MRIVTVMDYSDTTHITMCKIWLYLAKRFNPKSQIIIFYHKKIPKIKKFATYFSNITFIKLTMSKILKTSKTNGFTHPSQELKLAIWKYVEKYHIDKFLYIEPDAFILSSLDTWWKLASKKPYIAVAERDFLGHTLFNAGPHSYFSKKKFVTYDKLLQQYHDDGNCVILPSGEQGIINAYFKKIKYNCFHKKIGHEYNCIAKKCIVKKVCDDEIIIYSGNLFSSWITILPIFIKKIIFRIDRLESLYWWRSWYWWNHPKKVKILHAFGDGFKFWELPECKILWEYCVSKCITIEKINNK